MRIRNRHPAALLALAFATACGGGKDAGGRSPSLVEEAPPPAPAPDAGAPLPMWRRRGIGPANDLLAIETDLDGNDEILFAGRGLLLLGESAFAGYDATWALAPTPDGSLDSVESMLLFEENRDGYELLVVGDDDAALVDADGGHPLWRTVLPGAASPAGCVAILATRWDRAPDFFRAGSSAVHDGRDGSIRWATAAVDPRLPAACATLQLEESRGQALALATHAPDGRPAVHLHARSGLRIAAWAFADEVTVLHPFDADEVPGEELLVATAGGAIALRSLGGERWRIDLAEYGGVEALASGDVDGDGRQEIFVTTRAAIAGGGGHVLSLDATGAVRWVERLPDPSAPHLELLPDRTGLLVRGGVDPFLGGSAGRIALFDPASGRLRWRIDRGAGIRAHAVVRRDVRTLLFLADDWGGLQTVDLATGGAYLVSRTTGSAGSSR